MRPSAAGALCGPVRSPTIPACLGVGRGERGRGRARTVRLCPAGTGRWGLFGPVRERCGAPPAGPALVCLCRSAARAASLPMRCPVPRGEYAEKFSGTWGRAARVSAAGRDPGWRRSVRGVLPRDRRQDGRASAVTRACCRNLCRASPAVPSISPPGSGAGA
jgi:hypothetical protein